MNISHPSWVNTPDIVNICLGPVTVHYREVSLYAMMLNVNYDEKMLTELKGYAFSSVCLLYQKVMHLVQYAY